MNQLGFPLLSLVLWLPTLGALALLLVPRENLGAQRTLALLFALAALAASLPLYFAFDAAGGFQFADSLAWVPSWGIGYSVSIDGVSLWLVLLTTFLTPITLISTWDSVHKDFRTFQLLLLLLETGMLGVFVAMDTFLFYVFWELILIPMYFLIGGRDPVSARFQFSFRYRIFDEQGVVAETIPVASGLYFGFTQTSLWDLQSESKPFRDSSFRPSLFYRFALDDPQKRGSLALSGGYEHESNGKEDMPSRSIDTLFVRADARLRLDESGSYLGVVPKAWTYLDREDNPDIARYRGHAELGLRLGRDDGWLFSTLIRRGTEGKMGTQYDLSYPIRRSVFSGVGAFVHLQAFKGYGETLLEYDENKEAQYRIGVSLVR